MGRPRISWSDDMVEDVRRMDVRDLLRWQQIGDIGEDWCWKPGILGCSAKEE